VLGMGAVLSLHVLPCCCVERHAGDLADESNSGQPSKLLQIQAQLEQRIRAQVDEQVQRIEAQAEQRVRAHAEQAQRSQAQAEQSAARAELLASQLAARLEECDAKSGGEKGASPSPGVDHTSVVFDIHEMASTSESSSSDFQNMKHNAEATTAVVPTFQGVEELLCPPPDIAPDLAETTQEAATVEDLVSQMAGTGAELVEATQTGTAMVATTFNEVEEDSPPLPVDVPELDESNRQTVPPELIEASEENIAVGNPLIEAALEERPALRFTGSTVELSEVEDEAVLGQQAEEMLDPPMHDPVELARQARDHVAVSSQPDEREKEHVPPLLGSTASVDEVTKDATATAQLAEGVDELPRSCGDWEELCNCDGLSDGEDTMAFAGFSVESGRRLAHDAVLLMMKDALEMCDNPDFKEVSALKDPQIKCIATLRLAGAGWSGMHALLFYMWTFSDDFATKQLLAYIDVAFDSPPGTFMKKTEIICRYWYKLLHMPPQQKREDERARQMKDAFRDIEKLLLAYHQHHQQYEKASVTSESGVAAQAEHNEPFFRRLSVHYAVWALIPEICNVAVNADHKQMVADSKTHASEIHSYAEVFHALEMVFASRSYISFVQCSLMPFMDSQAVLETGRNLYATCGIPRESFAHHQDQVLGLFFHHVLEMQPVFPGEDHERVSRMNFLVWDDEAFTSVQKCLTRRQSHLRLLYDDLVARTGEAEAGTLKELVAKKDWVSARRRPRRSVGGA